MAIVMLDGSAASLRAVEIAITPQLMFHGHKDEQIILVHGWEDSPSTTTPASPGGSGGAAAQLSQQAAVVHRILQSTVEQIDKNKAVKDTLNYKIEMNRLSHFLGNAVGAARQPTPVPGGQPQPPSKPGTAQKGKEASVAAVSSDQSPNSGSVPPADGAGISPTFLVGNYVRDRARHHQSRAVVLGVGNVTNGKGFQVGRVAKEVYRVQYNNALEETDVVGGELSPVSTSSAFAAPWSLWYVKPTGSTIRLNAAVKFLVLVDISASESITSVIPDHVTQTLAHLSYACDELAVAGRGDRVGVLLVTPALAKGQTAAVAGPFEDAVTQRIAKILSAAGQQQQEAEATVTASAGDHVAAEQADEGAAPGAGSAGAAGLALPSLTICPLESTSAVKPSNVNEVPQQLTKAIGKVKVDFVVLPSQRHSTLTEGTVHHILGMPKPHVIVPSSAPTN